MSEPRKRTAAEVWRALEKLDDDPELARIDALSDDDLDRELRAAGIEPSEAAKVGQDVLAQADKRAPPTPPPGPDPAPAPPKVAPVVPIRKPWRTVGLLAAACVALFVIVKWTQGPEVVSRPNLHENAEAYRDVAEVKCALKDWAACKQNLDEAAKLDPEGESEPRVLQAREAIAAGMAAQPLDAGASGRPRP